MTEGQQSPNPDDARRISLPVVMPYRLDKDLWLLVVPGKRVWILLDSEAD